MADDDGEIIRKFELLRGLSSTPGWARPLPPAVEDALNWLKQHRGSPRLAGQRAAVRGWLLRHSGTAGQKHCN